MAVVCVCPSVWRVPRPNSTTERPRKPKIGRTKTAGYTSNLWIYLDVKRSKVKVTRQINAHTVNAQYLPNGKAYALQTLYTDGARRSVSPTSAVTSKVIGQSHQVVHRKCVISSKRKCLRMWNLVCRWSMHYQLLRPTIKACEVGFLYAGGEYRIGRTRQLRNLLRLNLRHFANIVRLHFRRQKILLLWLCSV